MRHRASDSQNPSRLSRRGLCSIDTPCLAWYNGPVNTRQVAWAVVLAVALAVAVVPPLREEAVTQWHLLPLPGAPSRLLWGPQKQSRALADAAADFVATHHPDDPEMLLGAAAVAWFEDELLDGASRGGESRAERDESTRALLRRAAEAGGRPAAWAAYANALIDDIEFARLGMEGVDPEDAEAVAEARKLLADEELPERIGEETARAALEGLRGWQDADPRNGMPVALEAWLLYGLHDDERALLRWQEAGELPVMAAYGEEWHRAARRVLREMGVQEVVAALHAMWPAAPGEATSRALRDGARMAYHQGRLAQMRGEPEEARRTWSATVALGRHMMASADGVMGFLVGSALQGIGARPAWVWRGDKRTGVPGGPLLDGRMWYGPQHDAWAGWVGQESDAVLRDSLVVAKVRAQLMREHEFGLFEDKGLFRFMEALLAPRIALGLAVPLLMMVLLYGVATLWQRRRRADSVSPRVAAKAEDAWGWWDVAAAVSGGAVIVLGAIYESGTMLVAGLIVWSVTGLTSLVVRVRHARRLGRQRPRWPESWRSGGPQACAAMALMYLTATCVGAIASSRLMHDLREPEIPRIIKLAGEAWRSPTIPPDSWRAEYPPEAAAE